MTVVERQVSGLEYLELATMLLQRARRMDRSAGVWEAADLQWWWRRDQHADPARQLFWVDGDLPLAAVVITDWGGRWGCELLSVDRDRVDVVDVVWPQALRQLDQLGAGPVETTVRDDDVALIHAVTAAGFEATDEAGVATWMPASGRPRAIPLPHGYRLVARSDDPARPHHLMKRNGAHVADRLTECSLYRPDLDLAVYAPDGEVAAYALFWADPETGVGLVEPMRTEDRYQRQGLATRLLGAGLDRLTACGCTRLKVTYMVDNEAARRLYLGAGFEPDSTGRTYRRHS